MLWKHTDWRTNQSEVRRSRRLSVVVHRHRRQLRLRLLLALLPGRLDPVRGEADRDHEHHGAGAGRDARPTASRSRPGSTRRSTSTSSPPGSTWRGRRGKLGLRGNMVSPPRGPENPHGNAFRAEATLLATEHEARRRVERGDARGSGGSSTRPQKNRLGQPVGYRLVPGENAPPFVAARRGRAASGPASRRTTSGSRPTTPRSGTPPATTRTSTPAATACRLDRRRPPDRRHRPGRLVRLRHTHVPRPEDWPVMPA